APEHVALQNAIAHEVAIARGHAFGVERTRAEAARQVRPFADRHRRGKNLFAGMIEQEARLAVQRSTADRRHEVTDQAARDFRHEQYGALACFEPARAEARERAPGRLAPDR